MYSADDKQVHSSAFPRSSPWGIIITVSFPAHGSFYVEPFKKSCVVLRAVLVSPVRMIDETGLRLFSFYRHEKGFDDEVFGNSRSQDIAYNLSVEEIHMGSTVKPAFVCRDIGGTFTDTIR